MNYRDKMAEAILKRPQAKEIYAKKLKLVLDDLLAKRSEFGPNLSEEEFENLLRAAIPQMLASLDEHDLACWAKDCLERRKERLDKEKGEIGGGIKMK